MQFETTKINEKYTDKEKSGEILKESNVEKTNITYILRK